MELEEITEGGNIDTAAFWENLSMQPKTLREGKLVAINDEGREHKAVSEEMMLANPSL